MKKIVFEKIQLQNFLSYGNDPVILDFKSGINFITGYNKDDDSRNGVGKTSLIVESLSFVLFGKTYRKVTQKEIQNRLAESTCSVSVWYSVNGDKFRITRSVSPSILTRVRLDEDDEVSKDGNETKTISETTKDILDDLGITKEVFENTLVMTAKNSQSFFSQDKSLKTKFIEGILGLECFSELFKDAKEEYNAMNNQIGKQEAALQSSKKSFEDDKKYEHDWEGKRDNSILVCENEISKFKELQDGENNFDELLTDIENKINDETKIVSEKEITYNKLIEKESSVKTTNSMLEKNLTKIKSQPKECPTCKRPFDEHTSHDFESEISEISKQISENSVLLQKIFTAKTKIVEEKSIAEKNCSKLNGEKRQIVEKQLQFGKIQDKIDNLNQKIEELKIENNPFTEKNKKTEEKITEDVKSLEENRKTLKILDGVKIVFSPTGVKSAIIKKIMNVFNERFGFYLDKLNTPCKIVFDEFFEEKVTSLKDQEISFDSFSEGEKGRVNFSLLFAFRDIRRMQSNVEINLSVFDELFDSSIDANASAQIMELLKEMSEEHDDCYYIITHNEGNVNVNDANVIYLEKENGITTIKNG